jgi:hypothetical protein
MRNSERLLSRQSPLYRRDMHRSELGILRRLIAEADLILSTSPALPENCTARRQELLGTALALTEDLIKESKLPAGAILGSKGGSVTAKRGSAYFRSSLLGARPTARASDTKEPSR